MHRTIKIVAKKSQHLIAERERAACVLNANAIRHNALSPVVPPVAYACENSFR